MRRIVTAIATTSLFVLLLAAPTAAMALGGALDTFKAGHTKVVELVASGAKSDAIEREVDQLLDYRALARESLGGEARYAEACAARCAEFEALLTRLIRENYLRRLRSGGEHKVAYVGEEARTRGIVVKTTVTFARDGQQEVVAVDYLMHEADGRWQVRDIITDGVSLARNYKFEFNQILKQGGIDALITRLEARLAELAKKG